MHGRCSAFDGQDGQASYAASKAAVAVRHGTSLTQGASGHGMGVHPPRDGERIRRDTLHTCLAR